MMRERVQELRYGIGDAMGDYAPEYFRRSRSSTMEVLVGIGSVLAAIGIGYIATRLSDRRLGQLIDQVAATKGFSSDRKRPTVHGTSGGEIPHVSHTERREKRGHVERPAVHQSDGSSWPKPETGSRH